MGKDEADKLVAATLAASLIGRSTKDLGPGAAVNLFLDIHARLIQKQPSPAAPRDPAAEAGINERPITPD